MEKKKKLSKKQIWVNNQRLETIQNYGAVCWYDDCDEMDPKKLQFAHRHGFPTKVNGEGRGSEERIMDVKKYPAFYRLLCRIHHLIYDKEVKC